jgi:hypothetical protein
VPTLSRLAKKHRKSPHYHFFRVPFPSPHQRNPNVRTQISGTRKRQARKVPQDLQPLVPCPCCGEAARARAALLPSLAAPHLRVWITTASHPQCIISQRSSLTTTERSDDFLTSLRARDLSWRWQKAVSSGPRGGKKAGLLARPRGRSSYATCCDHKLGPDPSSRLNYLVVRLGILATSMSH